MTVSLPETVRTLVDAPTFVVVTTLNPDGSPQSTVMWIKRDGDDLVFSTVRGRRKARNMERDPRVSVCGYDSAQPYSYFTVSGEVTLTDQGGRELIDELSVKYTGQPYTYDGPDDVRLVCRVTPRRVLGQ